MIRFLLHILLLFCYSNLFSQNKETYFSAGVQAHYGFVIVHSEDVRSVENSFPIGLSVDLMRTTSNPSTWNQCKCFPTVGLSVTYWNFNSPDILGMAINSVFFVEPEFGIWQNLHFSFRAGLGFSYLTKPYDKVSNPDNLSYSTHVAFPLQASLFVNYRLKNQWTIKLGVDYNHISNGGLKEPNKGINYPTASLGVNYYVHRPVPSVNPYKDIVNDFSLSPRMELYTFIARKEIETNNHGALWGFGGSAYWPISRINAVGGQLEVTHNIAQQKRYENSGLESAAWQLGIAATNDFPLGKFYFSQSFGYYLLKLRSEDYDFYQRYVLTYSIQKRLLIGVALRAHGHIADFLELRLGWQW
jgi:hypothetical protein